MDPKGAVVYGAGIKQRGATAEICDLSDILPTLVDFAGADVHPELVVLDVRTRPGDGARSALAGAVLGLAGR